MQAAHRFLALFPALHDDHVHAGPQCPLGREERRADPHKRVTNGQRDVRAGRVDVDVLILAILQAFTNDFVTGHQIAEQDHVGDQGQRHTLNEHLHAWPANGKRRHFGPGIAQRRNQDTPLNVVAHLTHHRADNARQHKAWQQAECAKQREETVFFFQFGHGQAESKDQANRAGDGRCDRLLQQKTFSVVDQHPFQRSDSGAKDDPRFQRVG